MPGRTPVANSKVALLRRVRTDAGWRYFPAAYSANGKVKPEVVVVAGKEVKHPTGYYALRYYEGPKLIIEALKNASPAEAEAKRSVRASRMSAVVAAREAGIAIKLPDPKRKTLATQLSQFLSDTADRGSLKARDPVKGSQSKPLGEPGYRTVSVVLGLSRSD